MKKVNIPAEVIVHFDTAGKITPYRIRYEKDGIKVIKVTKFVKRDMNIFAGNQIEVYECTAIKEGYEIIFALNFEKKLNKWFLTNL